VHDINVVTLASGWWVALFRISSAWLWNRNNLCLTRPSGAVRTCLVYGTETTYA